MIWITWKGNYKLCKYYDKRKQGNKQFFFLEFTLDKKVHNDFIFDFSGGTDIIACFMGHNWTLPVYRGEIQGLFLGCDMSSWNEDGK